MAVVIIDKLTKNSLQRAREDYLDYIKITIDIAKEIVTIGGEYHADAEEILIKNCQSKNNDIWGGGYNINTRKFETNAVLNIKPGINDSTEIINPEIREAFFSIARKKLKNIGEFI